MCYGLSKLARIPQVKAIVKKLLKFGGGWCSHGGVKEFQTVLHTLDF